MTIKVWLTAGAEEFPDCDVVQTNANGDLVIAALVTDNPPSILGKFHEPKHIFARGQWLRADTQS